MFFTLTRRVLLAILFALVSWPSIADVVFAPDGQSFSVNFPSEPTSKSDEKDGIVLTLYVARDGDKVFLLTHSLWPTEPDPVVETQSILDGMMERTRSELLSVNKRVFLSASGKALPAKQFTFGNAKLWGDGLVVISGRDVFIVQVVARRPAEGLDATGQKFMSSFKVLN